jgi:hypothetical protein
VSHILLHKSNKGEDLAKVRLQHPKPNNLYLFVSSLLSQLDFFFAAPQLVRPAVLRLRVPLPRQRPAAALPDEQVLRRSIPVVRMARDEVLRAGARGPDGSHGVRLPQSDQVHLPQVRSVGVHPEARQSVRAPLEHRQREDVHLHLVLVHDFGVALDHPGAVQDRDRGGPQGEASAAQRETQGDPHRGVLVAVQED